MIVFVGCKYQATKEIESNTDLESREDNSRIKTEEMTVKHLDQDIFVEDFIFETDNYYEFYEKELVFENITISIPQFLLNGEDIVILNSDIESRLNFMAEKAERVKEVDSLLDFDYICNYAVATNSQEMISLIFFITYGDLNTKNESINMFSINFNPSDMEFIYFFDLYNIDKDFISCINSDFIYKYSNSSKVREYEMKHLEKYFHKEDTDIEKGIVGNFSYYHKENIYLILWHGSNSISIIEFDNKIIESHRNN